MVQSFERYRHCIEFKANYNGAQTNVVIVGLPTSGHKYIVDALYVNGDTAGTFSLLDDENDAISGYKWYYGANGGIVLEDVYLALEKNRGIRFTQTGGGNFSVLVKYHEEDAS